MASLCGRVVAVTGAGRGIGAACARACAAAGAREVLLLARSRPDLERVAEEVERAGATAVPLPCDVTDLEQLSRTLDRPAPIEILVNGAGTNKPQPIDAVDPETFDRLWAVNVRGTFFASQIVVRALRRAGSGGVIVNISSQMGHVGGAGRTAYCATKHAVEGLTKALALEVAAEGIRVVSVAPTFVRTELTAAQLDDPTIGPELVAQIPSGRVGTPEEVAAVVVFAASAEAAMITGTSLLVDGGWTAR